MIAINLRVTVIFAVAIGFHQSVDGQPAAPPQKNLITNGDFEDDSQTHPPVGWRIWGGSDAGNDSLFVLDTNRPAGGKYAWRIHHPRGVHAFPVSDPKMAIRTKEGHAYLISFWARTANETQPGVFYLEAFKSIKPYQQVTSPLRRPIAASTQWRKYQFQVEEGKDFFHDQTRYLLLAFRPTRGDGFEQTLWIDDVHVSELPATGEPLFDPRRLELEPVNHRLVAGSKLRIVVDPQKQIGPATRQAGGVSFHRIAGWRRHPYDDSGGLVLEPQLWQAVRDLQLPMTRFYGVGDHSFSVEEALDRIAYLCNRCDIPQDWVVLELEPHTADRRYSPESWSHAVKYSMERGYKFRRWEICNEPYTRKSTAFEDPAQYAEHVRLVSEAIRAVQPGCQIGVGIHATSQPWGTYVLQEAAGAYDFVVGHYYDATDPYTHDLPQTVLASNYRMLNHILRVNATIHHFNPDGRAYQLDTEWGLSGGTRPGDETPARHWRNANIIGSLHRAVRMIYYAREGMLRGASGWEMFARRHTVTFAYLTRDDPDKRFVLYWLYFHFNRHCGTTALDISGTAPWHEVDGAPEASGPMTPALVTLDHTGNELYFVIANGSWDEDHRCEVTVKEFAIADAEGRCLSQQDRDADPLIDRESDVVKDLHVARTATGLSFSVPAHSVIFVRARRAVPIR